ncbi:alpha/beta-hydrolase [Rickenella mellea]|uniref:sn-1-specific diacylglycerol lipase n=1 Tax=Rickenella mellea TaxID=50990 RepID=A0A4R5XD95_9AGAM|nr:alpha/beta-hydrolase [Rickenella mellea]
MSSESTWEKYSKSGLNIASVATSVGFSAARMGMKLGFGAARGITSTTFSVAGVTVDYALFGTNVGTGLVLGGAVATAITLVEQLALAPILIGETVTSTSLVAARSSLDALGSIFPGSDEASFSLASFVALVRREWNEPVLGEHLPPERYSVSEVARALVAWAALQGVTREWQERKWLSALREIHVDEMQDGGASRERELNEQTLHVTEDAILPEQGGHMLTADIGDAPVASAASDPSPSRRLSYRRSPNEQLKSTLRRLSKMCLAGYGGPGLIFFGVSFTPTQSASAPPSPSGNAFGVEETATLAEAINAAEDEASATASRPASTPPSPPKRKYSWWNVLMGKHDQDIFEGYAFTPTSPNAKPPTAVVGNEGNLPRYWVLTDHGRRQIVLVFRGTMSLNELAVDLTCEPASFRPACSSSSSRDMTREDDGEVDGGKGETEVEYDVHGGMLLMARAMGEKGKPVHGAVRDALKRNKGYELVLCGHSFGAGVAALLALTWADPKTCLTVRSSGLPSGRRVSAYCFAPPCLTSAALASHSSKLITSFVHSHDVVARLSLGSVRDMTRASLWLCNAQQRGEGDGYGGVTKRALKWNAGYGAGDDPDWFLSIRKTLEANMHMAHLFPPGRVLWAIRDGDLQPAHRLNGPLPAADGGSPTGFKHAEGKVRLFEVLDVEEVFGQITFARDMLSAHLPDQYDRVLHELL